MSKDEELVEIYKASSEMEAQVIKGLLESYGIPCLLKSNAAPAVHVFTIDGMGEVRVLVWDSMVDEAKKHPDCLPIGDLPNVVVMDYTERGIKLRLLSRAKDQPTAFMMIRDLLYTVKKRFDAEGIALAPPRTYVTFDQQTRKNIIDLVREILKEKPKTN